MPWENLCIYFVKSKWGFTPPVTAELFKIKHFKVHKAEDYYLKGAISQAFKDADGVNTFDDRRFGYRLDTEIVRFTFPVGLGQHSLAFKRLDNSDVPWRIKIESFFTKDAELDYLNYLQARFGNINIEDIIMSLYSRGTNKSYNGLSPSSQDIGLQPYSPTLVLEANDSRRQLTCRTGMRSVILASGFNENLEPINKIENIPPDHNYEMKSTDNAIYLGEVWALSYSPTFISVTEFSLAEKEGKEPFEPYEEEPVTAFSAGETVLATDETDSSANESEIPRAGNDSLEA